MPTPQERTESGRALRKEVPRSAHGAWTEPSNRRDPVAILEHQATERIAELIPIRHARMAESAFAFFRGGAAIMAADLAGTPTTGLRVQACGDAHVGNFGKFATPERNLVFDINDFDETLPGPWEWDVKRLGASLAIAGHDRGFAAEHRRTIVNAATRAYRHRMADAADKHTLDLWYDRIHEKQVIEHFPSRYRPDIQRDVRRAKRKDHRRAVAKFTRDVNGHLQFVEDPPVLVHLANTEHDMGDVAHVISRYRDTLTDDVRNLFDRFRIVDIARRAVGVGSVGTSCWVALLEGPHHRAADRVILQVKEATASVLEPYVGESILGHHGLRVVAGQRLTQSASDIFLGWTEGAESGREYYVRQMWDAKGQGDLGRMDVNSLSYYGALCGWALARAHARTGDPSAISGYLGRSTRFDRAIVEFSEAYVATNERDYRRFLDAIDSGQLEAARRA
jgi:uncharacterized protein (DUF2252 family)